jgi:Flp pilus assembly pilin Flp
MRRLFADEDGLSAVKWALLVAAVAAVVVMYVPQFHFVIAWLQRLGDRLGAGAF